MRGRSRYRRRKGHFNEVYYLGLARNLPMLEAMLRQASIMDMINKDRLLECVQEASLAGVNARRMQRLDYTLSLLRWLCMQ